MDIGAASELQSSVGAPQVWEVGQAWETVRRQRHLTAPPVRDTSLFVAAPVSTQPMESGEDWDLFQLHYGTVHWGPLSLPGPTATPSREPQFSWPWSSGASRDGFGQQLARFPSIPFELG